MALTDIIPWGRPRPLSTSWSEDGEPFFALQRNVARLFDDFSRSFGLAAPRFGGWSAAWPHVDVTETETEVKVAAELPGLEEKDIELSLQDGVLTIKGEKSAQTDRPLHSERWHGQFRRSIQIGAQVDPERVQAAFRRGVLEVTLAKRPEAQAQVKRIPITTN